MEAELGVSLRLFEQPVAREDWGGLREVRRKANDKYNVAVAADESCRSPADARRIAEGQLADVINIKLAKFFHYNAIPFNLVESDELANLVQALCPSYFNHGLPGRFWMSTTGVDIAFHDLHEEVEGHLQRCDALMANMDGWENEKKQHLKIVTETGKTSCIYGFYLIQ